MINYNGVEYEGDEDEVLYVTRTSGSRLDLSENTLFELWDMLKEPGCNENMIYSELERRGMYRAAGESAKAPQVEIKEDGNPETTKEYLRRVLGGVG